MFAKRVISNLLDKVFQNLPSDDRDVRHRILCMLVANGTGVATVELPRNMWWCPSCDDLAYFSYRCRCGKSDGEYPALVVETDWLYATLREKAKENGGTILRRLDAVEGSGGAQTSRKMMHIALFSKNTEEVEHANTL